MIFFVDIPVKTIAAVAPIAPKNGLYAGHLSELMMISLFLTTIINNKNNNNQLTS